jgi:hypothetical protein
MTSLGSALLLGPWPWSRPALQTVTNVSAVNFGVAAALLFWR